MRLPCVASDEEVAGGTVNRIDQTALNVNNDYKKPYVSDLRDRDALVITT